MRSIASPEIGILIGGALSILFAYAVVRASYDRVRQRGPVSRWNTLKFWKEIGGGMIWVAGLLVALAISIKEYHDKLSHPY
jgi:hypothetical protein